MTGHPTLDATLALVATAHASQVDKAGAPYVDHPRRVMARLLLRWPDAPAEELHAALLHDVIEDTPITAEQLRAQGYSDRVLAILQLVTRGDETYEAFVERVATSGDIGAIRVKLSDLADNLDPVRVAALPANGRGRGQRYEAAASRLGLALAAPKLERLATMERCSTTIRPPRAPSIS